jgi:hypothetical protein
MKIQVTQDDIDQGKEQCCYSCPVARAINRILAAGCECEVGSKDIFIRRREEPIGRIVMSFKTPALVAKFIRTFDRGIKPEINMTRLSDVLMIGPFEFYLDIPEILTDAASVKV